MENIKYWIALEQVQGIGPVHLTEIYETLNKSGLSIIDLYDLNEDEIMEEFSFSQKICKAIIESKGLLNSIENDYIQLIESEVEIIPFSSPKYPKRLLDTMGNSSPPFLYGIGNIDILQKRGAAILGDKYVSEKGELIAYNGAKELAKHNIVTISGLAGGVDNIAHRAALENRGATVAVVPYGIFHFSIPDLLKDVFDQEQIVIISPFYPDKEINKYNAFIRNKIICAMSYAAYIVEAPEEGGIFEAAKSCQNLKVPLFTTEYSEYPENAAGNKKIIEELEGSPIRGKVVNEILIPNMDQLIGLAKFGD